MNKMRILAIAALLTVASYGTAFAAAVSVDYDTDYPFTVTIGSDPLSMDIKPSKNVTVSIKVNSTNSGYVMGACHKTGDKTYASSSGDTKIFAKKTAVTGTCEAIPAAPTTFGGIPTYASGYTAQ